VSHDNKNDERPQIDKFDDEILFALASIHLHDDAGRIDHEQGHDGEAIDSQEGGSDVVELLEAVVVIVDEHTIEQVAHDEADVEEVDDVRDGVYDISHVEH